MTRQIRWANVTAHANYFHRKMLSDSEAGINETRILVFTEIFNKIRIATLQKLAEMNHENNFFEYNLSLKVFVCVENTKLRWLNVIAE